MSNINRRDYLKGMAASAAVIAASKLEVFGQSKRRRGSQRTRRVVPVNWKTTEIRPAPDAFVTIILKGLSGFAYNPLRDEGIVGFHRGHGNHKLKVQVRRDFPNCDQLPDEQPNINGAKKITLQVLPGASRPVDYFEVNPQNPFNRKTGDPNDFRWLPDLDGPDFYPNGHDKDSAPFHSWLSVKNATFYTRQLSNSTFDLVDTLSLKVLQNFERVPLLMAAAIDNLATGQFVALQVDNKAPIKLIPGGGVKYQVIFINECDSSCMTPNPQSGDETDWNDFHFARKVLKLSPGEVKIGLKIHDKKNATGAPGVCGMEVVVLSTDEAPCMGAGYGTDRL